MSEDVDYDLINRLSEAMDDTHFWRNFAALKVYATSDTASPYPPARRQVLNYLSRWHWADRVRGRLPWQMRERRGEKLVISDPEDQKSTRTPQTAQVSGSGVLHVPHQRTRHPAAAELSERARRNSNRGGRA